MLPCHLRKRGPAKEFRCSIFVALRRASRLEETTDSYAAPQTGTQKAATLPTCPVPEPLLPSSLPARIEGRPLGRVQYASKRRFPIAGLGYSSYVRWISAALQDIRAHAPIDHLFICVDAEEFSFDEKLAEIEGLVAKGPAPRSYFIIVYNCCIETWFFGNAPLMRRNPDSWALRRWQGFYDVSQEDPEEMPRHGIQMTRAQTHLAYLKEMMRERNLSYSKANPGPVVEEHYFRELVARNRSTGHLKSFGRLVSVWQSLGAHL